MKPRFKKILPTATLLLLAALGVAQATYTPMYLPESSFWQGARTYTFDAITARVEYAVYDTALSSYSNVFDGAEDHFVNPGSGRYIYAYQITPASGTASISTFEVIGGSASAANGIKSQSDGNGGIMPTNNGASFVWHFEDGLLILTKHSAFMVFSSNYSPKTGSVEFSAIDNGDEPPTVPEPATLCMLSAGALALLRRKAA